VRQIDISHKGVINQTNVFIGILNGATTGLCTTFCGILYICAVLISPLIVSIPEASIAAIKLMIGR
jgi:hypothetical protein